MQIAILFYTHPNGLDAYIFIFLNGKNEALDDQKVDGVLWFIRI